VDNASATTRRLRAVRALAREAEPGPANIDHYYYYYYCCSDPEADCFLGIAEAGWLAGWPEARTASLRLVDSGGSV